MILAFRHERVFRGQDQWLCAGRLPDPKSLGDVGPGEYKVYEEDGGKSGKGLEGPTPKELDIENELPNGWKLIGIWDVTTPEGVPDHILVPGVMVVTKRRKK